MKMTVWDPSRKDNDLSKVIWDKKSYDRVHQVDQFHKNSYASPYDGCWSLQKQKH